MLLKFFGLVLLVIAVVEVRDARANPNEFAELDSRQEASVRQAVVLHKLIGRQTVTKPGLNVCYGTDSICGLYLDINCPFDASNEDWYKCICESGRLSMQEACQRCTTKYNLGGVETHEELSKGCSSMKYTIAPIPSSALSVWSRFNETVTYPSGMGPSQKAASGSGSARTTPAISEKTGADSGAPLETSRSRYIDFTTTMSAGPPTLTGVPSSTAPPPLAIAGSGGGNMFDMNTVRWLAIGMTIISVLGATLAIL